MISHLYLIKYFFYFCLKKAFKKDRMKRFRKSEKELAQTKDCVLLWYKNVCNQRVAGQLLHVDKC